MQIFPNLHWLAAGYASVNVYLYLDAQEVTVIDTGTPGKEEIILNYVRDQLGLEPGAVRQILITHADWDHAGSVAALQDATGAKVIAGAQTAGWLRKGKTPPHMPRPVQFFVDRLARFHPVETDLTVVQDGETLPIAGELEVLSTPGHTTDHHSFYSPRTGILFAGDALGTRSGQLGLSPNFITADDEAARRSAQRLLSLTPALFACGHGEPLQGHTLRDLMAFLQELK